MSYRIVQEVKAAKEGKHIANGKWPNSVLTPEEMLKHFRTCLHVKISSTIPQTGRKFSREYQNSLKHDRRLITEHLTTRIRRSGRNLLNCKELQLRYPGINTYSSFDD